MKKKRKTLVSFVLDETGSMAQFKDATISGFNEYISTLSKYDKGVRFTLTKFNSDKVEIVYDRVKLDKVAPLNDDNYQPNAMTPLYDAVGATIKSLEKRAKKKKRRVLVVIQTDGYENASKEYTREDIFNLIKAKQDEGWTFAFLGADQDAWVAGASMGVPTTNVMSYQSAETSRAFARVATATVGYMTTTGDNPTGFFEDDDD